MTVIMSVRVTVRRVMFVVMGMPADFHVATAESASTFLAHNKINSPAALFFQPPPSAAQVGARESIA
jgi:hypothetical protein